MPYVPSETGFLDRTLRQGARSHRYQLFRPRGERPERGWPVILFLHGAGERGHDGLLPTQVGLGSAIRRHAERFPCLVIFPQIAGGRGWSHPDAAALAMACLEATGQDEIVDWRRIYLTGISMGGSGVWYLGALYPETFAALAPVCGGVNYPSAASGPPDSAANQATYRARAEAIGQTPVWAFHGAEDPIVAVDFTRQMVGALRHSGSPARYTEYSPCGHDAWEPAYAGAELWDWLFRQCRDSLVEKPVSRIDS